MIENVFLNKLKIEVIKKNLKPRIFYE